jgi:general secretion pathway protein E
MNMISPQPPANTAPEQALALPVRAEFERTLLDRLLGSEKINAAAVERTLRVQAENGDRLEVVLANLGLVSEKDLAETMAAELGLPLAHVDDFPDTYPLDRTISTKFLRETGVLPLASSDEAVSVAMADPLNEFVRRALEMSIGRPIQISLAAPSDIQAAHERLFSGAKGQFGQIVDEIEETDESGTTEDVDRLRDLASEAPVIRLVNLLIMRAVERRASDIHVEPFRNRLIVRYRIDGVLQEASEPPIRLRAAVVSRIKIMARLNIAERRLPQDGRIRFTSRGRDLDLRVSTIPTLYGESVVMRILDRSSLVEKFSTLGFREDAEQVMVEALQRPQGILLVTGPTGSGKTTTLYTGLLQLNEPGRKVFTVEDPIEYELEGVNQVQVKSQVGLTFAYVLRSILRQDPDVVMIGEIRDLETAEVAVQASLTGHLVLSTLHTNDAVSSVTRLLDMGVADYLVTSTVNGVLAQRLVRKLCEHCRTPYRAVPEMIQQMGVAVDGFGDDITLYRPHGCDACNSTGYHGRIVITELLVMTDPLRRLVLKHADAKELQRAAIDGGMRTMHADGVLKALAGITTLAEVMRVTREA